MKKLFIAFMLFLTIGLVGCTETSTNQITLTDENSTSYSFMTKLELSETLKGKLEENLDKNIIYANDSMIVYTTFNNPDTTVTVATDNDDFDYIIGRHRIDSFLGYDLDNHVLYYEDNSHYYEEGNESSSEAIDFRLPIQYMNSEYFYTEYDVYDFLGNNVSIIEYGDALMTFSDYSKNNDLIYYMYDNSESTIQGFNLTQDSSVSVTLQNNFEFESFEASTSNNIIFKTRFGEAFVSINRDNEVSYFIKDDHAPNGYYGSIEEGIIKAKYPYFTYKNESNDEVFVVADSTLSNFIEVDDIDKVQYIDEDCYVLVESDNSNYINSLYQDGTKLYDYESSNRFTSFSRHGNYIMFRDYSGDEIDVYDLNNEEVAQTYEGAPNFFAGNYITTTNDSNELLIHDLNDFTTRTIDCSSYGDNYTFSYLDDTHFSIRNEEMLDVYDLVTLEKISFDLIAEFSYMTDMYGVIYGYLVSDGTDYFVIG